MSAFSHETNFYDKNAFLRQVKSEINNLTQPKTPHILPTKIKIGPIEHDLAKLHNSDS